MKKWLMWSLIVLALVILLVAVYFIITRNTTVGNEITNFEECIAAGNPAMESYPRQCRDSVGDRTFIEVIDNPNNENNNFEICDCSSDIYNCDDFSSKNEAQECFEFCMTEVGRDIHGLDNDGDESVCESL